jgi:hypothetical protein
LGRDEEEFPRKLNSCRGVTLNGCKVDGLAHRLPVAQLWAQYKGYEIGGLHNH